MAYGPPITLQPGPSYAGPFPGYAGGLESLAGVDFLFVKQKVELMELLCGFETNNEYTIFNVHGQVMFHAREDTNCCTRNTCGPRRCFDLMIYDNSGQEVIHLKRALACNTCWCPCCLNSLEVYSPPGNLIGRVKQNWTICKPKFSIKDANGETILKIKGPCCTCSLCGTVEFNIMTPDGELQVGKISKLWAGLIQEAFTDADNFGINFPIDLDVHMKAVMIGACILIDFMYFEEPPKQNN